MGNGTGGRKMGVGRSAGFTLIEMMIVVIVLGILTASRCPRYQDSVLKGNRAVAKAKLLEVAARQESLFRGQQGLPGHAGAFGFPPIRWASTTTRTGLRPTARKRVYVISIDEDVVADSGGLALSADRRHRRPPSAGRCELRDADPGRYRAARRDAVHGAGWRLLGVSCGGNGISCSCSGLPLRSSTMPSPSPSTAARGRPVTLRMICRAWRASPSCGQ